LTAGAPFYGAPPNADDVPKIKAAMMLHYADPTKDTGIGQRIPGYEAALKANNKTYQLFIYEGAQHGFHNDTTPRYDEAAAKLAWQRTLDFFNKNLR
jgi:carboxymethylenebutenolidase